MNELDDFVCEIQSDEEFEFEPGRYYWDEMEANP